ncbi:hypothetical protein [Arthrobacter sp. ERGS1:01]|uniref:hypothetical protein n=1 Tax=Arthrobacter sp. ERGS1:01 TaxID=1704044 RepID=UPI001237413C|nr:hypothetical protein [Arthrobacter sp. ERGS1:01]
MKQATTIGGAAPVGSGRSPASAVQLMRAPRPAARISCTTKSAIAPDTTAAGDLGNPGSPAAVVLDGN